MMRDYLRHQPDNPRSINILKAVVSFLDVLHAVIDNETISLITQSLDSLNEFSMGNLQNQHLLFDSNSIFFLSTCFSFLIFNPQN